MTYRFQETIAVLILLSLYVLLMFKSKRLLYRHYKIHLTDASKWFGLNVIMKYPIWFSIFLCHIVASSFESALNFEAMES